MEVSGGDNGSRTPGWVHAGFCVLVLASILAAWAVSAAYDGINVWDGWRESRELHKPVYAETVRVETVFRTRANTWSNLFYVWAGLYPVLLGFWDVRRAREGRTNYLKRTPALGILFGLMCCYLGVGSGLFHASLTHWGQHVDVAAMYSPLVALIALNIGRWVPSKRNMPAWPSLAALAIIASGLLYVYKWEMNSGVVLPALIAAVLLFGVLDRFRKTTTLSIRWLLLAGLSLTVAVACRQLDVHGRFSGPDSWFQGHSFWHLFTALCLYCMYRYYRSEKDAGLPSK